MSIESEERAAFLAAIHENLEDDTPRLVFADWLAERGQDAAERRLRYSVKVWQAIRTVSDDWAPATGWERNVAQKSLASHVDWEILVRLAAVAFSRRPCVWDRLTDPRSVQAVHAARDFADGFITRRELPSDPGADEDAAKLDRPSAFAAYAAYDAAQGGRYTATYSAHAAEAGNPEDYEAGQIELGYQTRVYRLIAALPPRSAGT